MAQVLAAGLEMPDIAPTVLAKNYKNYLIALLAHPYFGAWDPMGAFQSQFTTYEIGSLQSKLTVKAIVTQPAGANTPAVLDVDPTENGLARVQDQYIMPDASNGYVTAVLPAGGLNGADRITIYPVLSTQTLPQFSAANGGDKLGDATNARPESSSPLSGRTYLPDTVIQYLQIIDENQRISNSVPVTGTWIHRSGGEPGVIYTDQEQNLVSRTLIKMEMALMTGVAAITTDPGGAKIYRSEGVKNFASLTNTVGYAGSPVLTNGSATGILDVMKKMIENSPSDKYIVIEGSDYAFNVMQLLSSLPNSVVHIEKDPKTLYGSAYMGDGNPITANIPFDAYQFQGTTFCNMRYDQFSNPDIFPEQPNATVTKYWRNIGIYLNMGVNSKLKGQLDVYGNRSNGKYISVRYRAKGKDNRKFLLKRLPGMEGGTLNLDDRQFDVTSSLNDYTEIRCLAEIGLQANLSNAAALHAKIS